MTATSAFGMNTTTGNGWTDQYTKASSGDIPMVDLYFHDKGVETKDFSEYYYSRIKSPKSSKKASTWFKSTRLSSQ